MSEWNDWNSEWEEPAAAPAAKPSAPSSRSASRVEVLASPSANEPSWGDDWNTNWDSPITARASTKPKPSGSSKSTPRLAKKSPGIRSKLASGAPQSSTDVTQSKSSDSVAPSISDSEWIQVNRTNSPAVLLDTGATNGVHLDSPQSYGFEVPETGDDFEQHVSARGHEQGENQQVVDTSVVDFKDLEVELLQQKRMQQTELLRRDEEERIQRQLAFDQQIMRVEMEHIAAEEAEQVRLEAERRVIDETERQSARVEEERLQERLRRQAEEERLRQEIILEEQQRQENERERLRQEALLSEREEQERKRMEERLIAESIREEQRRQAEEDEKRRVEELAQLERDTKVAEEEYRAEQRRRQQEEERRQRHEEKQQRKLEKELRRKSEEEAQRKREEEQHRIFEEEQRQLYEDQQRRMFEEEQRERLEEEERVRAQREEEEERERAHQRAIIKMEEERQRRLQQEEADRREQERQVELARRADRRRLSEEARLDRERLERLTSCQESQHQTVADFSLLQESPEGNENLMQALERDLEEEHESNVRYNESVLHGENLVAQNAGPIAHPLWDAVPSGEQFDSNWDVGISDFENVTMAQQPVFDANDWNPKFADDADVLDTASHAARTPSVTQERNPDMAELTAINGEEEALMSETAVHMVDGLMDGVPSEPHSSREPSMPSSRLSNRLSIGSLSAEPALPTDPQSSTFVHEEAATSSPKSRRSQDLSFSLSPLHSEKASDDEIDGNRDYRGDVSGSSAYDGSERNFPKENGNDRRRYLSGDYSDYSETDHPSRDRYSSRTSESEYDGPRHRYSPSENRSSSHRDDTRSEASGETVDSAGTSWTITDPSERILRAFGVMPPQQSSFTMPLYTTMMYPFAQQSMYNPVPAPPTFFPSAGYNMQTSAAGGSFHVRKHLYPHSIGTYHIDVVQVNNLENTKYLDTMGVSRRSRVRPEIYKFPHNLFTASAVTDDKLIAFCRFMADNINDFGYLDVNKREEGLLWSLLSLLIRHGNSVRNFAISEILMTSSKDPSLNLSSASLLNGSFNESYPGEKRLVTVRKSLAAGLIPRACKAAEDLGRTPLAFMLMSLPSVIKTNNKMALAGFLRYIEHTLSPVDPIYTACMLMCGGNPKLSECVKNWTSHVALVIGCGAFIASAAKTKFLLNLAETLGACGRPVARDVLYLLSRPGSRIRAGKELKLIGSDVDGRTFDGRIDTLIEKVHMTEVYVYVANKLQSGTVHALATGFQIRYLHFLLDHQLDMASADYMAYIGRNYLNAADTEVEMTLSLFGTVMSNRSLLGPEFNDILSGLRSMADQGIVKMRNQLRLNREEEEQRLLAERFEAEEAARLMNEQVNIMNETAQRAKRQEAVIRAAHGETQRSQIDPERVNDPNRLLTEAERLEDLRLEEEFYQVATERERVKSARWEEAERIMLTTDSPVPEMHVIEPTEQTQPPPVFFSVESSSHTTPGLPFFGVGNMDFRRGSAGDNFIPTGANQTQPVEDDEDEHLSFFKLKKPDDNAEESGSADNLKSSQEPPSSGLNVPVSVESAEASVMPDVHENHTMPDKHRVSLFSDEPVTLSEWPDQNVTRFPDVEGSRNLETSVATDGHSVDDQETVMPVGDPSQYYHLNFTGDVENASVESDAVVTADGIQQPPPGWSDTQTIQGPSHTEQTTGAYYSESQAYYPGEVPAAGYQSYWNPYYPSQGETAVASDETYQPVSYGGANIPTGYYTSTGQSSEISTAYTGEQTTHQSSDKTRTDETGHTEQTRFFPVVEVEEQPSHPVSSAPNYWGGNAGYSAQSQFSNQPWGNPPSSVEQSLQGRVTEVPSESDEEPVPPVSSHPPGMYNYNAYTPVPATANVFQHQPPPPASIQSVPPPVRAASAPAEPKKPGMLGRFTGFFRKSQDSGVPPAASSGGPTGTSAGSIPMFSPDASFVTPFTGSAGVGTVPAYPAAFISSSSPSTQHGWSDISLHSSQSAAPPMYTNAPTSNVAVPYWNTTYSTTGFQEAQYNGSPNVAAFSTGEQNSHPVPSGMQLYGISDQQQMGNVSYPAQFAQFSADVAPGHQMPPLY